MLCKVDPRRVNVTCLTPLLADIPRDAARSLARLDVEHLLLPVLLQLAVIIAAARLFGAIARRLKQPSVVGEIAAGLLLGPSFLGWLVPDLFAALFRPSLAGLDPALADAMLAEGLHGHFPDRADSSALPGRPGV